MTNNQAMAQRHVGELYSKLLEHRMSYDGRRAFVVGAHYQCKPNGTLPSLARNTRPAMRILQMDFDVGTHSRH